MTEKQIKFLPRCPECNKPLPWQAALSVNNKMKTCEHCQARLIYREFTSYRQRPLHALIGLAGWLMSPFAILFAFVGTVMVCEAIGLDYVTSTAAKTGFAIVIIGMPVTVGLACGMLMHIHSHRFESWQPKCSTCGYSLKELQSDQCPECGTAFDRNSDQFKGTVEVLKEQRGRPMSAKWVVLMTVGFLLLNILVTAIISQIKHGQLDAIGWPLQIYGQANWLQFHHRLSKAHLLADSAMCLMVSLVVEYIRQWFKAMLHPPGASS